MSEVENVGSVFDRCTFRRTRFNASTHKDAAFLNCTFVACSLFDTRFDDRKLVGSMFDGCSFEVMQVSGGDWSFVGLPGADLQDRSAPQRALARG